MSLGYLAVRVLSTPKYRQGVEDIMTKTIVARMQMDARPAPFRFILYAIEDTETKWLAL